MLGTQSVTALVLFAGREHLVTLYSDDAKVAALAASLILYAAAFQFPDGAQVLSNGSLRGLKDTRLPMLLAAVAYWGIGIPLGAWLALGAGLGPKGMWMGMIAGLSVAAVLLGVRFLRVSRVATPS
jgi:MATE family multidrug resistance protein